jgi:hypothetical protein
LAISSDFLQDRIDATEAQIIALETAITTFISTGLTQSYTLDTGQTRQTVTNSTLSEAELLLESLYNRLANLNNRRNGCGVLHVIPGF